MYKRVLAVGVALAIALLAAVLPGRAAPLRQWRSVITYPEAGATVGGIVEIRGIATHVNFDSYQVRYAPGSNVVADSAWVDIVMLVPNPVDNGVLCTWDTTTLPDGPYVLALAVWGCGEDEPRGPQLNRKVVERLSELEDSSFQTRWLAASQLGELGDAAAVEPLIKVLKNDDNSRVRQYAAEALGKLGDSRATEPLLDALRHALEKKDSLLAPPVI